MRCLYCGKELALLKRLTGGGEFCSDAHRHQYQEEYNQLALNRLLQAKPREKLAAEEAKSPAPKHPEPLKPAAEVAPAEPPALARPVEVPAPVSPSKLQDAAVPQEQPAPAGLAGFLDDLPLAKEPQAANPVSEIERKLTRLSGCRRVICFQTRIEPPKHGSARLTASRFKCHFPL